MQSAGQDRALLAEHGAKTIAKGSKSFALASLIFRRDLKADVHMLYAWCRHCDDVIDGQTLGGDAPDGSISVKQQKESLETLRHLTRQALAGRKTNIPAFDGFGEVAARHDLPAPYAMDLLDGFARDVDRLTYATLDETLEYCYGVAGVVGVMMAIIMGVDRNDHDTLDRACDLGLAFQLTNICRDIVDDAEGGRVYLPGAWLEAEGVEATAKSVAAAENREAISRVAARLLKEADHYYASASEGVRRLPLRAAGAVLAARNIYRDIGRLVIERGAAAWDERTVVRPKRKFALAFTGAVIRAPETRFSRSKALPPRGALWRRPSHDSA